MIAVSSCVYVAPHNAAKDEAWTEHIHNREFREDLDVSVRFVRRVLENEVAVPVAEPAPIGDVGAPAVAARGPDLALATAGVETNLALAGDNRNLRNSQVGQKNRRSSYQGDEWHAAQTPYHWKSDAQTWAGYTEDNSTQNWSGGWWQGGAWQVGGVKGSSSGSASGGGGGCLSTGQSGKGKGSGSSSAAHGDDSGGGKSGGGKGGRGEGKARRGAGSW
jgi:hypothetical protein